MKILIGPMIIIGFVLSSVSYAETNTSTKAPDDVVTRADINKCVKHLKKTEKFHHPEFLKVASAHYTIEESMILLTLNVIDANEYGAPIGKKEMQCELEK